LIINISSFGIIFAIYLVSVFLLLVLVMLICQYLYLCPTLCFKICYTYLSLFGRGS